MKDRSLIRLGAGFGFAGAILAVLVNLLHPRTTGTGDIATYDLIADSSIWAIDHYFVAVVVLALLGGYVALVRYLDGTPGEPWARLGFALAIAASAVGLLVAAVDGYALKTIVDRWVDAGRPSEGAVFEAVHAVHAIGTGLFNTFNGTVVGIVPVFGGIAVVRSGRFVGWIGLLGIVGGAIGLVIDLYGTLSELTPFLANVVFTAGALMITVWALVVNWTMFKAAGEPAQVVEPHAVRA